MNRKLDIINPPFDSPVTDLIIEIDNLRKRTLRGTTLPSIFFQIKHLFHILESIGSTRIEGNHTTVAEFIDNEINTPENTNESIQEIKNNEMAINFIEENMERYPINRAFISELHKIVVHNHDFLRHLTRKKLKGIKKVECYHGDFPDLSDWLEANVPESLAVFELPKKHW